MNQFWSGFLAGAVICPLVLVIAVWVIFNLSLISFEGPIRKVIRKLTSFHISRNPPKGIKRSRRLPKENDYPGEPGHLPDPVDIFKD